VIDPANPSTVYTSAIDSTDVGVVERSTDGGASWVKRTAGLTAGEICALAADPKTSGTLYAGGERGVFKSTNAGARWAPFGGTSWLRTGGGDLPLPPLVFFLAVDPQNPARLYAADADRVFELEQRAVMQCAGDCDGDDRLSVEELIEGVAIALGIHPLADCPPFDSGGDGAVGIDELTTAVDAALDTCLPDAYATDFSDATQFEYTRGRGRGFCPPVGGIYSAQLLVAPEGLYDFYHATLEEGVPGVDQCEPGVVGVDCAVVRYHPERTLTPAEAERVRRVFANVTVHSQRDRGCPTADPCVITSARWDRVRLSDYACADRRIDDAQRAAIDALLEDLHRANP
jgi:hypothetical protein